MSDTNLITVTIDGVQVQVTPDDTILTAANLAGVEIPTLCYLKDLNPEGSCRMCLVEVEGNAKGLVTACTQPCTDGMVVHTKSHKVIEARRFVLDLLLSNHEGNCFSCAKNGGCKLQDYCFEYGVEKTSFENPVQPHRPEPDDTNKFLSYDPKKCILCRRCQRTCAKIQGKGILSVSNRGFNAAVTTSFEMPWENTECEHCGNCAAACPTGALVTKDNLKNYRPYNIRKVRTT